MVRQHREKLCPLVLARRERFDALDLPDMPEAPAGNVSGRSVLVAFRRVVTIVQNVRESDGDHDDSDHESMRGGDDKSDDFSDDDSDEGGAVRQLGPSGINYNNWTRTTPYPRRTMTTQLRMHTHTHLEGSMRVA